MTGKVVCKFYFVPDLLHVKEQLYDNFSRIAADVLLKLVFCLLRNLKTKFRGDKVGDNWSI